MKLIGLLGGMSPESTAIYYSALNRLVQQRLGGQHSARVLLYSVDFDEIAVAQHAGDWDRTTEILVEAARSLERGGADFALLGTNTMHKVFDEVQGAVAIPFLHVVDAAGERIRAAGHRRVALLGTRFTMEQDFYRSRLDDRFGIEAMVPDAPDREAIHRVIYEELCRGQIREDSRREYVRIIQRLGELGAEGVILGCTEIGMLIRPEDSPIPPSTRPASTPKRRWRGRSLRRRMSGTSPPPAARRS